MRLLMTACLVTLVCATCGTDKVSSSQTNMDERERARIIKHVEGSLLSLFGFNGRPRKRVDRAKVHIPPAMVALYKRQTGLDLDTANIKKPGLLARSANTVRSFTHVESPVDQRFSGHHKFRLYFDITSVPKKELLKAAEVTINRDSISTIDEGYSSKSFYRHLLIYDIVKPGRKGKHEPIIRLIDSKMIDTRQNSSINVDVLPAVERWLENPKNNYGILVQLVGKGGTKAAPVKHLRLKRGIKDSKQEWSKKQPLLFTYTDDGKNVQRTSEAMLQRRNRRAPSKKHKRKDGKELCKRHSMYVDFNDVGWNDWIVAPPGYDAFYCHGECVFPLADHMNTTNHAIVQTLMNSMTPGSVPTACCVPTSLNSISMLYLDEENKVVLKNYQDMAVVGCGCR